MKYLLLTLSLSAACAVSMESPVTHADSQGLLSLPTILALYHTSQDNTFPAHALSGADNGLVSSVQTRTLLKTDDDCYAVPEGDREVASGSVSSRWTYKILQQGTGNSFYVVYWRQNNCSNLFYTSTYTTQNAAYQEFRRNAEEAAY